MSWIIDLALEEPELSPRELAVQFTDEQKYFVSEASVYRLLIAHDLITSPAYVVIKAAEEFKDKTAAPNQIWQSDFPYLKIMGWGRYYLSNALDDFSRFIVAWKLCATMKAQDVTATLDLALTASGLDQMTVVHRPQLAILPIGWTNRTSSMSVQRPIIRRPRARSSAGIKHMTKRILAENVGLLRDGSNDAHSGRKIISDRGDSISIVRLTASRASMRS